MTTSVLMHEKILAPRDLTHNADFHTLDVFVYVSTVLCVLGAVQIVLSLRELLRGFRLYRLTKREFPRGVMLPELDGAIGHGDDNTVGKVCGACCCVGCSLRFV